MGAKTGKSFIRLWFYTFGYSPRSFVFAGETLNAIDGRVPTADFKATIMRPIPYSASPMANVNDPILK